MLPKVATHILHSTSRAAATIHSQTHTLRNVWQIQPTGSSGSGSGRGSNGPGPGGAKYNTGSRFYSGYNGAGRAVTQANAVTSNDGEFIQDDSEEHHSRRAALPTPQRRTRIRSASLSHPVNGRRERGEKLGVLRTVQMHTRSRHVFAPKPLGEVSSEMVPLEESSTRPSSPALSARRHSTASRESMQDVFPEMPTPPSKQPTKPTPAKEDPPVEDKILNMLQEARASHNPEVVAEAIARFRKETSVPTLQQCNLALEALFVTRQKDKPLDDVVQLYNDMLDKSIIPDERTCMILLDAFLERDVEVQYSEQFLTHRLKRHAVTSKVETIDLEFDKKRMAAIKGEQNFTSAMLLFDTLTTAGFNDKLHKGIYHGLLRGATHHKNLEAGVRVFTELEKCKVLSPDQHTYHLLIRLFTHCGDSSAAEETFEEYNKSCREGRMYTGFAEMEAKAGTKHLLVWNAMIDSYFRLGRSDKAIELLDRMLASTAGVEYTLKDTPVPAPSTYTAIINGFCEAGDIQSALSWFHRLLQQGKVSVNRHVVSEGLVSKPDSVAWTLMLNALAFNSMVDDLNRLFTHLLEHHESYKVNVKHSDRVLVAAVNLNDLDSVSKEDALHRMQVVKEVLLVDDISYSARLRAIGTIAQNYIALDAWSELIPSLEIMTDILLKALATLDEPANTNILRTAKSLAINISNDTYKKASDTFVIPLPVAFSLSKLTIIFGFSATSWQAPAFLRSYFSAKEAGAILDKISLEQWAALVDAALVARLGAGKGNNASTIKVADDDLVHVLKDMVASGIAFEHLPSVLSSRLVKHFSGAYSDEQLKAVGTYLGEHFEKAVDHASQAHRQIMDNEAEYKEEVRRAKKEARERAKVPKVHTGHNDVVHTAITRHDDPSREPLTAYNAFVRGLKHGHIPAADTVGLVIQGLGRIKELDKARHMYDVAQVLVDDEPTAWYILENSMVIALAQSDELEAAHVHRLRLLEQGKAPSADAYGALILRVKDTTDDASNAMALFNESQAHGVNPNLYLYNNIISKLSRARKADYALELFQQMKAGGVSPSSVTYGALIGACARVGDTVSAENLFIEMTSAHRFKPRVPPYNTMMQLYTTTKPNRERALYYYEEMLKVNVKPSPHTYKLLLDVYGAVEPVDLTKMEEVFQKIPRSQLQGIHFACLINAYGCVGKDLQKAIDIFDSIPTFDLPTALDAVVFETLFNAFVANRRADLIPEYLTKMFVMGIHMTAYIANTLIKGYSNVGDIENARSIFEALADAPVGVAAPNNHAPHDPERSPTVSPTDPVYREPSTWEAIIRAELGVGNRDEALALLERLRERQYPEAVFNRISGIMVDHSVVVDSQLPPS